MTGTGYEERTRFSPCGSDREYIREEASDDSRVYPDQLFAFDLLYAYGHAEHLIAFFIGSPAIRGEMHAGGEIMEERPHRLVRIALVTGSGVPRLELRRAVTVTVTQGR